MPPREAAGGHNAMPPCPQRQHWAQCASHSPHATAYRAFKRARFLEYAKVNGFIKQHVTTAEIQQSFGAFLSLAICIERGADGCQAGLKVERRVRFERD
jgi:hypothetical protein